MTGEIVENLAAQAIAGADANRLEPVEHVELGKRDAGDARHGAALAHQHRVEPTAAPLAPGHAAELMNELPERFAGLIGEVVGEGAATVTRRIGLGAAEHGADIRRTETQASRAGHAERVRTGDDTKVTID